MLFLSFFQCTPSLHYFVWWVINKYIHTYNVFEKGNYLWLTELFRFSRILDTTPITHRPRDLKENEILCGFYYYELQNVQNTEIYQIENILKDHTHKGKRQLLVCWLRYNSDFDSWISAEDIHNAQWFICYFYVQCLWSPPRWLG